MIIKVRSQKTISVKRRIKPVKQIDFSLETQGDVRAFLSSKKVKPSLNLDLPQDYRGPAQLFKDSMKPSSIHTPSRQALSPTPSGDDQRTQQETAQTPFKTLSVGEKIRALRESRVLDKHASMEKYWERAGNKISQKLNKPVDSVFTHQGNLFRAKKESLMVETRPLSEVYRGLFWQMSLRTAKHPTSEVYFCVGGEREGVYCKMQYKPKKIDLIRKPSLYQSSSSRLFQRSASVQDEDFGSLIVAGQCKLRLEEEALDQVGQEYLDLELLDKTVYPEETIEAHYDTHSIYQELISDLE